LDNKEPAIQFAKIESDEKGRYGNPVGNKTVGAQSGDIILKTRIHEWRFMTLQNKVPHNSTDNQFMWQRRELRMKTAQPSTGFEVVGIGLQHRFH